MNYKLQEAIRLAERALHGNAWTGGLDKREVQYAVHKLIDEAKDLDRENDELKRKLEDAGRTTRDRG